MRPKAASGCDELLVHPWAPVESSDARVLVLGTMPSPASIADGFYYGHPRNAFWWIMGELFGAGRDLSHAERAAVLRSRGLALWDVLSRCRRPGALDADISVPEPNDFAGFFMDHPRLRAVLFNGAAAGSLFRSLVLPHLGVTGLALEYRRMPSTSPAHARPLSEKMLAWGSALAEVLDDDD